MIAFLEKLTKRKTEVTMKGASDWQKLVGDVLDETASDPDDVLDRLDRLHKTTDDLSKAVELLRQRRVWAREAADGETAETDLNSSTEQLAKFDKELEVLLAKHEARLLPIERKRDLAIQRISQADSSRRRLIETASDPILKQAARDTDANMAALRQEQSRHKLMTRGFGIDRDAILKNDDPALKDQAERLANGINRLKGQEAEFLERAAAISQASEAAREQLLRPEAI